MATLFRPWRWFWLAVFLVSAGIWAASYWRVVWVADEKFNQVVHVANGTATWHYATTCPAPAFGLLAGIHVTPPPDVFVWH